MEMLKCLKGEGHLYALDIDPIESVKTKERLKNLGYGEEMLSIRHLNFADIDQVVEEAGPFDFILQISEYRPCRLTIRIEDLHTKAKDLWICV